MSARGTALRAQERGTVSATAKAGEKTEHSYCLEADTGTEKMF